MLQAIGITFFLILMATFLFRKTSPGVFLLPSDFFMAFFALTWSPLCFFPIETTHVSTYDIGDLIQIRFTLAYALLCISLSLGFLAGSRIRPHKPSLNSSRLEGNKNKSITLYGYVVICLISIFLVGLYLVSAELRSHLKDIWSYVIGLEIMSYAELRREVQHGGFVFLILHSRLQYSIVFLLFTSLFVYGILYKEKMLFSVLIAGILFVVCATTLKKMPFVYFSLSMCVAFFLISHKRGKFRIGVWIIGCISAIGLLGLVYGLYRIQYRDVGSVDNYSIINTIKFRVLTAYPDGFKLYLALFPDPYPFTHGKTIGLLQPLIGYTIQPSSMITQHFGINSTFPGGFVSYAYTDFGMFGIVLISFWVGYYLDILNRFICQRKSYETKIIAQVTIGLSTLWLCQLSISAALLTGGLGLIPILIYGYEKWILGPIQPSLLRKRKRNK